MASLLSWGKKVVRRVAHDVNNDIVHPVQRVLNQPGPPQPPLQRPQPPRPAPQRPAPQQSPIPFARPTNQTLAPVAAPPPKPIVPLQVVHAPPINLNIGNKQIAPSPNTRTGVAPAPPKPSFVQQHFVNPVVENAKGIAAMPKQVTTSPLFTAGREAAAAVTHNQPALQNASKDFKKSLGIGTPKIQPSLVNKQGKRVPNPAFDKVIMGLTMAAGEGGAKTPGEIPKPPSVKNVKLPATPKLPADNLPSGKTPPGLPAVQQGTKGVQATPLSGTPQTLANNTTKQVKGLTSSIKQSNQFSPELKKAVTSTPNHSNLAEKALIADQNIKNLPKATTDVLNTLAKPTHQLTDQNAADAIAVMKAHDAAGNTESAQQIHDLLATHGETSGQFINSFKLISNRTPEGMLFGARRALKGAGIDITPQMEQSIKGHIDNIKQTAVNTPERDLAVHNFVQHVHSFIPSSIGDKAVNFWRAGLLTSPITTGGNIIGNTGEALTRNVWTNPIAAAVDKTQSVVTGKRTKTLAGGQTSGAVQGVKDSANYLKTGFDPNNPLSKFEQKSDVNYGQGKVGKAVGGYVSTVYRGLGAQDKPFRQAATNQAAGDLAKADAINLGLKGKARSDYIAQARSNPEWKPQTFQTGKTAQRAGAYAVFGNETALGHAASALKNPRTYGGHTLPTTLAQFVLPFSQVPASIAVRIMERSNLGAGEVIRQLINVKKGLPYDQRAVSEAIANGTFGPAIIATGYALQKSGGITGNYPTDPKEQKIWQAQGKQPNAVRVGNRWYSLNYVQPFGALLGIGAQAHKDVQAGKNPTEVISSAVGTAAKSVESQSFLQGINGLLTAVNDPQQGAQKYVDQVAGSVIPNVIKAGAKATDPMQRDTKGIGPSIKGGIPGVRESLPVKQDLFGRGLKRGDNALNTAFNPFRSTKVVNDPVVNELGRLQDAGQGIIPTQFKGNAFGGKKTGIQLTPDQTKKLQTLVGTPTYKAYQQVMNDPRYSGLSDEQKKAALSKAGAQQSDAFKRQFAVNNDIPLTKPASKTAQKILSGQKVDPFAKAGSTNKSSTDTKGKYTHWTASQPLSADRYKSYTSKSGKWASSIKQGADKYGLDADAVLAVAGVEGLGGGVGDGGTSFGPFQLHSGGALPPGKDKAWVESPEGIDYALQRIAQVAKGKKGQDAVNAIVRAFERPTDPNGEVARALQLYGHVDPYTKFKGISRSSASSGSSGGGSTSVRTGRARSSTKGRSSRTTTKASIPKLNLVTAKKGKTPKALMGGKIHAKKLGYAKAAQLKTFTPRNQNKSLLKLLGKQTVA